MEAFKYGLDIPYIQQLLKKTYKSIHEQRAKVQVRRTRRRTRRVRTRKMMPVPRSKNIVLPISTFSLNLNNRYNILGSSN